MTTPNTKYMQLAIRSAEINLKKMDGGPFGAVIVKGKKIIAVARNTVLRQDATCHAEISAIRKAARKLGSFDLSGCVIYSTCEPCPMCFSAIHWSRIAAIVYGTSIADAKKIGFHELPISSSKLKALGKAKVHLTGGFLYKECLSLFQRWNALENKQLY